MRRATTGFTLIEVLVALAIMAVMTAVAWQGLSTLQRTREHTQARTEAVERLSLAMAQWEADLAALHFSTDAPALQFDGATLSLTRSHTRGVYRVQWTCQQGQWWRRQDPPVAFVRALQDQWLQAVPAVAEPAWLRTHVGCDALQVYAFRQNAWTNLQSAADRAAPAAQAPQADADPQREALRQAAADQPPEALRLLLQTPQGPLTRDQRLPPKP